MENIRMKRQALTALTLFAVIGTVYAIDMPVMKEGLWKLRSDTTSAGEKPDESTYFLCRDHAYDLKVKAIVDQTMKSCSNISDSTSGGKRYLNMTCKVGSSSLTSKAVITSTGDTYYRAETTTTYTPPLYGQTQSNIVLEETWVSACPAGMSPGDRKLADGTIQKRHSQPALSSNPLGIASSEILWRRSSNRRTSP
jgi:hypothetical protein